MRLRQVLIPTMIPAAAVLGVLLVAAPSPPSSAVEFHLALEKSEPAADVVVAEVSQVTLWFTQEPQEGTTSIRLVDADGEMVPSSEPAPAPDDATAFSTSPEDPLVDGAYQVVWRAMAADGHVVNGDFGFTVRSSE